MPGGWCVGPWYLDSTRTSPLLFSPLLFWVKSDWCFFLYLFTTVLVPDPLHFFWDLSGFKFDVASVHHFDYVDRIVRLGCGPDLWR
jgi:hypothetical protein